MKKIITVLILIAFALVATSCEKENTARVAVLWSNISDTANLSDEFDNAMRFKSIKCVRYDAKGSETTLIRQAKEAIGNDSPALIVNCKYETTAVAVIALAKNAGIPVIFMASELSLETLSLYDKCYSVASDSTALYKTLGERIAKDVIKSYEKYDRNGDGNISYVAFGIAATAAITVNERLSEAGLPELMPIVHDPLKTEAENINSIFSDYNGSGDAPIELIITPDDNGIEELLLALREHGLNHKSLKTHFIPLYTVGASANAGQLADTDDEDKRTAYTVRDAVDDGFLSAAALEDDDTLAKTAARVLRNLLKDKDAFAKINKSLTPEGNKVSVKYTIYG